MKDNLLLSPDETLQVCGVVYDMPSIFRAESRIRELRGLTNLKAGELLHCFIMASGDARRHLASLHAQLLRAKEHLKAVRGMVVLDRAPGYLKERGLATTRSPGGSEDLRDAVVHTDADYREAAEQVAQVQAAAEFMESKVELLKMAYFSTHKLMDPRDISQQDTSGGTGDREIGAATDMERVREFVDQQAAVDPTAYRNGGFGVVDI